MSISKTISISSACLLISSFCTANAANVIYEISGVASGLNQSGLSGPIAELLGLPTDTINSVPYSYKLTLDTDNPNIYTQADTPIQQHIHYRDSIVSAQVNINGIIFDTLRRPVPTTRDTPSSDDESHIEILNNTQGSDILGINLNQGRFETNLFNTYTLPYNQTLNGTFIENAVVSLEVASFVASGSLFDNAALPFEEGFFGDKSFITQLSSFVLHTDVGGKVLFQQVEINASPSINVTTVPVPAAAWLFGSALIGFIGIKRKVSILSA